MANITIISKQNGVGIVLPSGYVHIGDPDGDFVAEAGSATGYINIKRDIDDYYIAKELYYTSVKDSSGSTIGTSGADCVSKLNSLHFNRTSKISEIDDVSLQNTIAEGQILRYVNVGGGVLRISNETAVNQFQSFTDPQSAGDFQYGARLIFDAYGTSPSATAGTLVSFGNTNVGAVGAQSASAAATGMLLVVTSAGTGDELLVEGVVKMSSNTGWSTAKKGAPLYMSTQAGSLTVTAPSTAGDFVRIVGHVVDAANSTIYFKPDVNWVEL